MTYLGALPAFRLGHLSRAPGPDRGFATAPVFSEPDLWSAVHRTFAQTDVPAVIVIEPDVQPTRASEAVAVPGAFLGVGAPVRYPARSRVTHLSVPRGLLLVARNADLAAPPALMVPQTIGWLWGTETADGAFAMAHGLMQEALASDTPADDLARAASIGMDAENGAFWVLGALSALAGDGVAEGWNRQRHVLTEPNDTERQVMAEARRVRGMTGVPVAPLTAPASAAVKALLSDVALPADWSAFVMQARAGGGDLAAIGDAYARAADRLWPAAITAAPRPRDR
ncbi:MAG: hypothetical protein AAF914_13750 [Pseudomonadota bacterium]